MYLDQALFFTLASNQSTRAHEGRVYREMNACFAAAAGLMIPAFIKVAIPYRGRTLPGWLLVPAGAPTRRPTVILNNGSDGQNIDSYVYGGAAALERGYNALIFEGPGQGRQALPHLTSSQRFQVAKRSEIYGNRSLYQRLRHATQFKISRPLVQRISSPMLLTEPAQEASFPGQAKIVYAWLQGRPKKVINFTDAQGAQLLCEPMAPTIRNDSVFDWVEANLRPVA